MKALNHEERSKSLRKFGILYSLCLVVSIVAIYLLFSSSRTADASFSGSHKQLEELNQLMDSTQLYIANLNKLLRSENPKEQDLIENWNNLKQSVANINESGLTNSKSATIKKAARNMELLSKNYQEIANTLRTERDNFIQKKNEFNCDDCLEKLKDRDEKIKGLELVLEVAKIIPPGGGGGGSSSKPTDPKEIEKVPNKFAELFCATLDSFCLSYTRDMSKAQRTKYIHQGKAFLSEAATSGYNADLSEKYSKIWKDLKANLEKAR